MSAVQRSSGIGDPLGAFNACLDKIRPLEDKIDALRGRKGLIWEENRKAFEPLNLTWQNTFKEMENLIGDIWEARDNYSKSQLAQTVEKCNTLINWKEKSVPDCYPKLRSCKSSLSQFIEHKEAAEREKSSKSSVSTSSKSSITARASSQISPFQESLKPFVQSVVKPKPDYYDPKDTPGGYVPSFNPVEGSPGKPSWQKNSDTPGGYEPSFKDNPILRSFQTSEGVTSVEAKEAIFKLPDYAPIELPPFSGVVTAAPATVVDGRDLTPGGYVPYSSDSLGSEGDASSLGQKVATPGGYNPYGSSGGGESQWTAGGVGYPTDGSGNSSYSTQPSAYDRSGGDVGSSGAISSGYNPDGSSSASDSYGISSIQGTGESRLAGLAEISAYSVKDFFRGGVYSPQASAYDGSDAGGESSLPTDIATPGGYNPYGSSSAIGETKEIDPAAINDRY